MHAYGRHVPGPQPAEAAQRAGRGQPQQQVVTAADGRVRRRAVFGHDALPANGTAAEGSSGEDEDEEGSEDETDGGSSDDEAEEGWQHAAVQQQRRQHDGGSDSEEGEEEEGEEESEEQDDEGMGAAAAWKANMLQRAAALFRWAPVRLDAAGDVSCTARF